MNKFLILLLWSSLSACATYKDNTAQQQPVEVTMLKYKFVPAVLEIKSGQTVRWINKEKRQYHSIWFDKQAEEESDYLFPADFLEKKFTQPGKFEYRCGPHSEMTGIVIVSE